MTFGASASSVLVQHLWCSPCSDVTPGVAPPTVGKSTVYKSVQNSGARLVIGGFASLTTFCVSSVLRPLTHCDPAPNSYTFKCLHEAAPLVTLSSATVRLQVDIRRRLSLATCIRRSALNTAHGLGWPPLMMTDGCQFLHCGHETVIYHRLCYTTTPS